LEIYKLHSGLNLLVFFLIIETIIPSFIFIGVLRMNMMVLLGKLFRELFRKGILKCCLISDPFLMAQDKFFLCEKDLVEQGLHGLPLLVDTNEDDLILSVTVWLSPSPFKEILHLLNFLLVFSPFFNGNLSIPEI
jgi:hypothetical protein